MPSRRSWRSTRRRSVVPASSWRSWATSWRSWVTRRSTSSTRARVREGRGWAILEGSLRASRVDIAQGLASGVGDDDAVEAAARDGILGVAGDEIDDALLAPGVRPNDARGEDQLPDASGDGEPGAGPVHLLDPVVRLWRAAEDTPGAGGLVDSPRPGPAMCRNAPGAHPIPPLVTQVPSSPARSLRSRVSPGRRGRRGWPHRDHPPSPRRDRRRSERWPRATGPAGEESPSRCATPGSAGTPSG